VNKEILTERELQDFLGISRTTIWKLRKNDGLPYAKLGKNYRYIKADIVDWLRTKKLRKTQEVLKF